MRHLSQLSAEARASLLRGAGCNLLMPAVLVAFGQAWLYLVWALAFLCINPLVSRIRQVAEHGAVPDLYDPDPRRNTRTVAPSWLERLLVCPHQVSYHLEHHLLPRVPIYRLRRLHRLLRERGFYDDVHFPRNYLRMLQEVPVPG